MNSSSSAQHHHHHHTLGFGQLPPTTYETSVISTPTSAQAPITVDTSSPPLGTSIWYTVKIGMFKKNMPVKWLVSLICKTSVKKSVIEYRCSKHICCNDTDKNGNKKMISKLNSRLRLPTQSGTGSQRNERNERRRKAWSGINQVDQRGCVNLRWTTTPFCPPLSSRGSSASRRTCPVSLSQSKPTSQSSRVHQSQSYE